MIHSLYLIAHEAARDGDWLIAGLVLLIVVPVMCVLAAILSPFWLAGAILSRKP